MLATHAGLRQVLTSPLKLVLSEAGYPGVDRWCMHSENHTAIVLNRFTAHAHKRYVSTPAGNKTTPDREQDYF